MHYFVTSVALLVVSIASANSLTCNEGFNGKIGGVPFYHWTDRKCSGKSDCFMQELSLKLFETDIEVTAKYGGCISSRYAPLMTCENLFGADSTFDPARLLNMMPELEQKFKDFLEDMRLNTTHQFQILFSNGNGSEEFIEGLVTFTEHLGFKMEKVKPLIKPMAECWNWLFASPSPSLDYQDFISRRINLTDNLLEALGNLESKNTDIAEYILSFIGNWADEKSINEIRDSKYLPLLENLPELVKMALPNSFKASSWFDSMFELLGDIRISEPKTSAFNTIKTMKSMVEIPKEYNKYLDPILNTAPELVQHMADGDYMYAGTWSAELVKSESKTNSVTKKLSTSIFKFISSISQEQVPADINVLITWLPGVFYNFFPEDSTGIDRVYNALSDGFDATDVTNPTNTLPTTKMSDFLVKFTEKFIEYPPGQQEQSEAARQIKDLLVINFSKTFYNIMTSKYTDKLNIIFDTLAEGLKNYPDFDTGKIVENLITNLGWTVPTELKPLLNTAQGLVKAMMNGSYEAMREAAENVIQEYEEAYPKSEFPDLVRRYIDYYHTVFVEAEKIRQESRDSYDECPYTDPDWLECFNKIDDENRKKDKEFALKLYKMSNDLSVDTSFAIFRLMDYDDDVITSVAIKTFPQYATYIRLMRVLDSSDIKDLLNDFTTWFVESTYGHNYTLLTLTEFTAAINATVFKITSKLGDVTKELRNMFAPDSCKYEHCSFDGCNADGFLAKIPTFSPPPSVATPSVFPDKKLDNTGKDKVLTITDEPPSTTSGSNIVSGNIMLSMISLWLSYRAFME
ncbi:uncharacterized protein LOC120342692 isoform X1 [Styela clava]